MTKLIGRVSGSPWLDDRLFYHLNLEVQRLSGTTDSIPVLVHQSIMVDAIDNDCVMVDGSFCSHNKKCADKVHLMLYVLASSISIVDYQQHFNHCSLDGFICKSPIFRTTPKGRCITDVMVAVNRLEHHSDYIPCVFWDANSYAASQLSIGDHIRITGRIQSREYIKNDVSHTAYELSVDSFS